MDKPRKKRKPMTPEQREAAAKRLEKAREAKAPAKNLSVHESIRDLEDDHPLSPKKVKEWIKVWQEKLKSIRHYRNSSDRKEVAEFHQVQNYINNMQLYLSSGSWNDLFYGEKRSKRYYPVCIAQAFDRKGNPVYTQGIYYPLMGGVYMGNGEFKSME